MYLNELMDKRKNEISFHMPSHKEKYHFFEKDILFYDLTEYDNYDNLANPTGVILNSLERIAKIFKSEKSFILVNGSTVGILASILYAQSLGGELLACRLSHKSFFNAITLTGQKVTYFNPILNLNGFFYKLNLDEIEDILNKNDNITSLFITSLTYEGMMFDIKALSDICKKRNIVLIVDEAHGAHLPLSDKFLQSSIEYADIVVTSLHKTLPALTQTALLHCKEVHYNKINKYINMLQTSSPSYIFMYAIDKLMADINSKTIDFDSYIDILILFRQKVKTLKNIFILDGKNVDITRITLYSNVATGLFISNYLKSNGIFVEMFINNYVVLISSVCDLKSDFVKLFDVLSTLDTILDDKDTKKIYNSFNLLNLTSKYTLKEMEQLDGYSLEINKCLNKISKDFIIPYPPGIPIVLPGEIITKEVIDMILKYIDDDKEIIGVNFDNNTSYINVALEVDLYRK